MDAPRELTLPPDLALAVRNKAMEGGYADEMDVIRDGLAAIAEDDLELEEEMIGSIRRDFAAWQAGTLETTSMDDFLSELAADRAAGRRGCA